MRKFDNFCTALANLKNIHAYEAPYDVVTETGLVARLARLTRKPVRVP